MNSITMLKKKNKTLVIIMLPTINCDFKEELEEFKKAIKISHFIDFNSKNLLDVENFYYKSDGHWNAQGHEFVGKVLSEYFKSILKI